MDRRAFEHRTGATEPDKRSLLSELPALDTPQFARAANNSAHPERLLCGLIDAIGLLTPLTVGLVAYTFFGRGAIGDEIEEPLAWHPMICS